MIAVLGAGPHGRQLAHFFGNADLFDDNLDGFKPCEEGATLYPYVVGAAWPKVRRQIVNNLTVGTPWERGQVIFPGVHLGHDAKIGAHTHLLFGAVVSHGCTVGNFVTICSNATLCGEVTVEDDVFIGAGATIIHGGITIGRGAIVGAGSVVTHDVPAHATVVGSPAQQVRVWAP